MEAQQQTLYSCLGSSFPWPVSHSQHEILDFLSPDIHWRLPFVLRTFHFPHQEIRFQFLIVLHHRIIMDGYEPRRRLLPLIQINFQLCSSNRNWRSLGKDPGCLACPTLALSLHFFPPLTGATLLLGIYAVQTITTVWWLMTKVISHQSVLVKTGLQQGVLYPGTGCKSNEITSIETKRKGLVFAGKALALWGLQASSCTSRGWVEDALLPTELIRTQWSTAEGRSRLGLQFARLE